jgi:hypothetical protein
MFHEITSASSAADEIQVKYFICCRRQRMNLRKPYILLKILLQKKTFMYAQCISSEIAILSTIKDGPKFG